MFLVGSFVKITDISECKKIELNEVFKVLSSSKAMTIIENKDGINLGGYYSWRFEQVVDPAADATKTIADDDWFYFDVSKHAGHVLRRNIDQLKSKNENTDWTSVSVCANTKICLEDINKYEFRCKKSDTPKEFTTNAPKPPEDDWVELDETIYADHILRENIDECKSKINLRAGWERVCGFRNKKLSAYAQMYNFRCRRSVLPVTDVTKSQAADATKPPEDDWFHFDISKHAGHILRRDVDQVKSKHNSGIKEWVPVSLSAGTKIYSHDADRYEFRCKKSDIPKEFVTTVAEGDWVIIDKSIYGDFKLRLTDECNYKNTKWMKVVNDCGNSYNHIYYKDYEFRCKRSDLPVVDTTKSSVADATKSPEVDPKKPTPFCVGQEIICNEKGLSLLTYNKAYTVLEANTLSSGLYYVKVKDDKGDINQFLQSRFRVADTTNPPTIQNKDAEMFKNRFEVGQKILCTDGAYAKRITNGKEYVVINNTYDNNGSGMDMLDVINDNGEKERYFVSRFSAATAENVATAETTTVSEKVATAKKRAVAKVTNSYLTKGQSYEVVDDGDGTTVIVGPNSYSLCFMNDCFESDISLSDVTNVDGATGTKENEMKKETAIKVASMVGKFAAGWGFRALNYWAIEPAVNIARPILSSVRYAGFLAAISMVGYGMYNPQAVKDAAYSCIPKISLSIEAPEILNGK